MKTEQSAISAVNRQIFSLSNLAKKFIQSLLYLTMLFGYGMAHASSNSTNLDLNIKEKLANSTNSTFLNLNNNFSLPLTGSTQNPTLSWSRQDGDTSSTTSGRGVSADNNGNIYVVGFTAGTLSGQKPIGALDYFIAKYDQASNLLWIKQVDGGLNNGYYGYTEALGVSADNNGNIYVVGYTTVGISGQIQNGADDYFIAKYDTNGNLLWTKQVGTSGGNTYGQGISADNSGNIYVTGYTTVGISGQIQNGVDDYFIAKYDTNGNLLWTKQVGTSGGSTYGQGISTDNSGNIYVAGFTGGGISGQKQNGLIDYFIAKYDANSNLIWSEQVGGNGYGLTYGYGVSADNSGNIYVTGYTYTGISGQKQNGSNDYFIAGYNQSGNLKWTRQVGGTTPDGYSGTTQAYGVSTDNSGNIYIVGQTNAGISGQIQHGFYDYFIAQYNQSGNLIWTDQVNGNVVWSKQTGAWTDAYGVSADNNGNVYVTGFTNVGLDGQTQHGFNDYFIAKYAN